MTRHRVYLDQNKWISLLREHVNDADNDESMLSRLRELVEEGEIVCPLSLIHLIETASYSDDESVDEMFDLMLDLSLNRTMAPMPVVREEEVETKADEWLGRDTSMEGKVVGEGLAFAVGGRHYDVVSESGELDDELRDELLDAVESEWASELLLESEELRESMGSREYEQELVEDLEEVREENEQNFDDNSERRKHEVMGYFRQFVIGDVIQRRLEELATAPAETIDSDLGHGVSQERLESEEYAWEWIQDFPAIYTHVSLTTARDLQSHRDIHPNDLNDIMALSVAIPYCDTVVTENFWTDLSRQVGLGELYDTNVTADMEDVFDSID